MPLKEQSLNSLRVALVHDWLFHMRGGEKVLEAMAEVFPKATIYTLFSDRKALSPTLQGMRIRNSILQYFPGIKLYYRWLLPLLPFFARTLKVRDADLVISSSHCVAKGVRLAPGVCHICYCHTPMRYLWGFEREYFGAVPGWLRGVLSLVLNRIRKWDKEINRQVDHFLCNSEAVQKRIHSCYGREAVVVHPPVDTEFFNPTAVPVEGNEAYLVVSALTPYKRIDLVIEAFNRWDRRVWVAGDGPERRALERLVKSPNVRLLGKVSDEELRHLYAKAKAVIFPQEEDFGIVPLEAQAMRTPVIAYARGGALETVQGGVFFYEQSPEALRQAVLEFEKKRADRDLLRGQALRFDKSVFKTKIAQAIENVIR